jgi:thiol-disulfide isomerase/thioredoxin
MKFHIVYIFSLFFFIPFKQSIGRVKDSLNIIAGTSKITGRIISPSATSKDKIFVNITVPHPISGENVQYKTFADSSGDFSIDVDVETDVSLIGLNVSLNPYKYLILKLNSGGVTNIDISYNLNNDIKNIDVYPNMNQNDVIAGFEVMGKMIEYKSGRNLEPLYNKSIDYFLSFAKTILNERLEILKKDTLLSKELKDLFSKDIRLFLYKTHVFAYEEEMKRNYLNTNDDKNKEGDIQTIDRAYFRFLKDFNLNDQQYLQTFSFLEFQKEILQNETLGIPKIEENDIPSWLASVKIILADLIGFENGPYYDVLVANAFGRQLNEEVRPLSKKQIKHIIDYWGDGDFAKILFRKNKEVIELNKVKSPAIVKDISSVPDDQVIETILSAHQNKVILIDLWATWCGPCLNAMERFKNIKGSYYDKEVVFVYLTNSSSPLKLWEEKIIGIYNEHYYLTDNQWKYVMKRFQFEGIPSYLLFNKKGELVNKFTAFPENEKVKMMIDNLL